MSEKVSGRSSVSRMWSITCPTVQNGGTATKSVCMRRPAVSSGYSRLRSSAARSPAGICARISCLSRLIEVFQQVGGVVGLELGDGLGQHVLGQLAQQLVAHRAVEFGQDLGGKIVTQRLDELDARVGLQQLDDVGEVGRRQAARELARPRLIATGKRLADGPRQLGGGLPILAFVLHAICSARGAPRAASCVVRCR